MHFKYITMSVMCIQSVLKQPLKYLPVRVCSSAPLFPVLRAPGRPYSHCPLTTVTERLRTEGRDRSGNQDPSPLFLLGHKTIICDDWRHRTGHWGGVRGGAELRVSLPFQCLMELKSPLNANPIGNGIAFFFFLASSPHCEERCADLWKIITLFDL